MHLHLHGLHLNSGQEVVLFDQLIKGGVLSDQRKSCKQNLCNIIVFTDESRGYLGFSS